MKIPFSPRVLGRLLAFVLRLWGRSLRVRRRGTEVFFDPTLRAQRPVIILWHDEIFPLIPIHAGERLACVVSQSRDGEILAQVLECLGFATVRGSSSRGGLRALVAARRFMEATGRGVIFTVDGPRGPRHRVKPGAVFLAGLAGSPIVPVRVRMERVKIFHKAWDKFQLPWPFSRCTVVYGEPVRLAPAGKDQELMERHCRYLEDVMHRLGQA